MLKIRGMSIVGNFLTGVNRFGHGSTGPALTRPPSFFGRSVSKDVVETLFRFGFIHLCLVSRAAPSWLPQEMGFRLVSLRTQLMTGYNLFPFSPCLSAKTYLFAYCCPGSADVEHGLGQGLQHLIIQRPGDCES